VLLLACGMSLWFNRGRAFIAAASILAAYAGYRFAESFDPAGFPSHAVLAAVVLLVPLNALAALALPERGVSFHGDHRWLLVALAEALLVAWMAASGRSGLSGAAWQELVAHPLLRAPPVALPGRVAFAAAIATALWRAWPRKTDRFAPLDIGVGGALAAFFIGCEAAASDAALGTFTAAAGAILIVAMLQESHRLAFRDELTGLPGRRALEEALAGLGPVYALAMSDVDQFKNFNDTHGHDIGDQVLKLVAARLDEVGGGGRAFRYGGEEFTLLFPGMTLAAAMPHLEAVRAAVESYRMAVRGEDRPKDKKEGARRRGGGDAGGGDKTLSVTISIGGAEPAEGATPAEVMKAADEALYRAKRGGRNRVSR